MPDDLFTCGAVVAHRECPAENRPWFLSIEHVERSERNNREDGQQRDVEISEDHRPAFGTLPSFAVRFGIQASSIIAVVAFGVASLLGGVALSATPLPPLPHTVGMSGPDVDLIESGIAAYGRHDLRLARTDFRRALRIRSWTAVANFNLGVVDVRLGRRAIGTVEMRRGFTLANAHGMGASPQAQTMRTIAADLGVRL